MAVSIQVDLTVKTCSCGSLYAVPHWIQWSRCPMCAGRKQEELEKRNAELVARERRLKAAITRAKNRKE